MEEGQIPVVPIVLGIFALVAVIALAAMAGLFVFLISRAAKRRSYDQVRGRQMEQAAGQLGWSFRPQADLNALPFFSGFELFEGSPLKFENLLTGKVPGQDSAIFDLAYRNVGGGRGGTTTSRQTMFMIVSPKLNLPEFYLRPEGAIEKVLNAISRVDIDFAGRPGFSQKFLLHGKDEAAIRRLFDVTKLDFFEKNPNICVSGRGNCLLMHASRTVSAPNQIGQYAEYFGSVFDIFAYRG